MCLTKRYVCSGDSGGDWELALPERRRRGSYHVLGGRWGLRSTPVGKGYRSAPLAAVVFEAEGSKDDCWDTEDDAVALPPPSPVNLGWFWSDLGDAAAGVCAWFAVGGELPGEPPHLRNVAVTSAGVRPFSPASSLDGTREVPRFCRSGVLSARRRASCDPRRRTGGGPTAVPRAAGGGEDGAAARVGFWEGPTGGGPCWAL
jgi:hypothetical protein